MLRCRTACRCLRSRAALRQGLARCCRSALLQFMHANVPSLQPSIIMLTQMEFGSQAMRMWSDANSLDMLWRRACHEWPPPYEQLGRRRSRCKHGRAQAVSTAAAPLKQSKVAMHSNKACIHPHA